MAYDYDANPRYLPVEEPVQEPDEQDIQAIRDGQAASALLPWATGSEWAAFVEYLNDYIASVEYNAFAAGDYASFAERRGERRALQQIKTYPQNLRAQQERGLEAQARLQT